MYCQIEKNVNLSYIEKQIACNSASWNKNLEVFMFKKFIVIAVLSLSSANLFAMKCGYVDGKLFPADAEAKKLMSSLKPSTQCTSGQFEKSVKLLGKKIEIVVLSDSDIKKITAENEKRALDRLTKRLKKANYKVN